MRCTASRPATRQYNLSIHHFWTVSFGKNDRSFAILLRCTGQVRAFARTFGILAPTANSASGGFLRQIPPLPVTPAVGRFKVIRDVFMIKLFKKVLLIPVLCFVISACGQANNTSVVLPSQTPSPSSTRTHTPTLTPSPTATLTPYPHYRAINRIC